MRTRNQKLNEARRQDIVEAAIRCFVRDGFHGSNMQGICKEAGMSPGTLYHYFRSKDEIISAILDDDARYVTHLITLLNEQDSFITGIETVLTTFIDEMTTQDLLIYAEVSAEVLRKPELHARLVAMNDDAIAELAAAIERGKAAGDLRVALDAPATARIIAALIDGLLWHATLNGHAHARALIPAAITTIDRLVSRQPRDES